MYDIFKLFDLSSQVMMSLHVVGVFRSLRKTNFNFILKRKGKLTMYKNVHVSKAHINDFRLLLFLKSSLVKYGYQCVTFFFAPYVLQPSRMLVI